VALFTWQTPLMNCQGNLWSDLALNVFPEVAEWLVALI